MSASQSGNRFSLRGWMPAMIAILIAFLVGLGGYAVGRITKDPTTSTPTNTQAITQDSIQPDTASDTPTATSTERTTLVAPYNLPPQPYIPHPSLYLETGIRQTKVWQIELLPNTVAIIGGYEVDGLSGGVYKVLNGPGLIETTVTDGFVSVVQAEWGKEEFCFRIKQAEQFGWAHAHLFPLPEWEACP